MERPAKDCRELLGSRDAFIFAMLLCAGLTIRWLSSGGQVYGDESWYLYLAKTFGSEPASGTDNAWFHIINRPLYYVVFHLGSYAGFAGFRLFGSLVGACSAALVYVAARGLGAARVSAACTAGILCVQRPLVEYGAHGFPDPLAAAFAVAAIWLAAWQRAAAACVLACCCVLSKESFVVVPAIAVFVRLTARPGRGLRPDAWAWATLVLPTAYVAAITVIGTGVQGIALQGWSQTPLSWKHVRGMWVGPELWPILGWCFWRKRWQWLAVWLGMPVFYLIWSYGLGRGMAPWYVIGPASMSALAAALAFTDLRAWVAGRFGQRKALFATLATAGFLIPVAWAGVFRTGSQVSALRAGWPRVNDGQEVLSLLRQYRPDHVLLVNCFWSYGYSHLRGEAVPARRAYWPPSEDMSELEEAARAAQLTILCRRAETSSKEQQLATRGFQTLLVNSEYWVLGHGVTAGVPALD